MLKRATAEKCAKDSPSKPALFEWIISTRYRAQHIIVIARNYQQAREFFAKKKIEPPPGGFDYYAVKGKASTGKEGHVSGLRKGEGNHED